VATGATNGKLYDARQLADEIYAVVVDVASKCRCDPATPRIYAKPIGLDNGMVKYRLCTSSFDGRTCLTLTYDKFFQKIPQLYPPPTSMVVTVAEGAAADAVDAANFPLVTVFADIAGLGVRGGQDSSFVNRAGLSEAARAANIYVEPAVGLLGSAEAALQKIDSPGLATLRALCREGAPPDKCGEALAGIYDLPKAPAPDRGTPDCEPIGGRADPRGERPFRGEAPARRGGEEPQRGIHRLFDLKSPDRRGGEEPAPQR